MSTEPELAPDPYVRRYGSIRRYSDRARTEREELYQVLDAVPVGTLSTVVDGVPLVVPMLFARDGDRVLLHGSTGAGALREVAAGAPAAFSVISLDSVVVSYSTFESSADYRSAVVHGHLEPLADEEKYQALERLSDRLVPGRSAEVAPMTKKELAATLAMALPVTDGAWTVKVRSGPPADHADADRDVSQVWSGRVPMRLVAGPVDPAPWNSAGVPVPESVLRLQRQYPSF